MDLKNVEKMLKPYGSIESVHEGFMVFRLKEMPPEEILKKLKFSKRYVGATVFLTVFEEL